jgi:hypothetical protein
MTSFAEEIAENRRICILRILEVAPEYAANDSVMQTALERFGFPESRDQVRTDMAWLAEQALVTVDRLAEHVWVARLTTRGGDVAKGRVTVPGVKRPGP